MHCFYTKIEKLVRVVYIFKHSQFCLNCCGISKCCYRCGLNISELPNRRGQDIIAVTHTATPASPISYPECGFGYSH